MHVTRFFHRIHPLVAVAAVTVTLFSLLGIAAITGLLPASHGNSSGTSSAVAQPSQAVPDGWDANKPLQKHVPTKHAALAQTPASGATGKEAAQPAAAPAAPVQTAQTSHKPAPQNSPVGIGVGALIGGVLGNQIGSGDGKTLATIAGAIGGGYVGNEIAKKGQ